MPRRLQSLVVFAAPGLFVVLWATGFIGAKFGLPYAEPLTFLALGRARGVAWRDPRADAAEMASRARRGA